MPTGLATDSIVETSQSTTLVETDTPSVPTPTPVPMVAVVNGEGITFEEYQGELNRFRDAAGRDLAAEDEQLVLDNLIREVLMAQYATENGYVVSEQMAQERLDILIEEIGGTEVYQDWLETNHYTEVSFLWALQRSIAAAWTRDQIAATVPEKIEQVHAQQVLVFDEQEADEVLRRLEAGADFEAIAFEYDQVTRGDLSWFPRGYLYVPQVEEAAFELEPGQYSEVIESEIGFHIVYLLERDPERELLPDARNQRHKSQK